MKPSISKGDFELVQDLRLRDIRVPPGQTEVFPLLGIGFCADCGEPILRKTVPVRDKRYVCLLCLFQK